MFLTISNQFQTALAECCCWYYFLSFLIHYILTSFLRLGKHNPWRCYSRLFTGWMHSVSQPTMLKH